MELWLHILMEKPELTIRLKSFGKSTYFSHMGRSSLTKIRTSLMSHFVARV